MRSIPRVTLQLQQSLVRDARLYTAVDDDVEAVERLIVDYARISSDLRKARARLHDVDEEGALLDERLERLQAACRAILDL